MRKALMAVAVVAVMASMATGVYAQETQSSQAGQQMRQRPSMERTMPKLYDKDGNELTQPPKFGEAVYDKNGNQLKAPQGMRGERPPMMKKPELNLSDEQKSAADKIRQESRSKMKTIRKDMHNLDNKIWNIMENDSLTKEQKREKLEPIHEKMKELRTNADKIRQEDMKKFEGILNDEQKKTLEQFKKEHKPQRMHRGQGNRDGHPGINRGGHGQYSGSQSGKQNGVSK